MLTFLLAKLYKEDENKEKFKAETKEVPFLPELRQSIEDNIDIDYVV